MGLQLVADYRNLQILVREEIAGTILLPEIRDQFAGCDFMTTINEVERAWLADCIEACTLLSVDVSVNPAILRVIHRIDRSNILRSRLFKLITSQGYHHVPEGELRIDIRPTGLYLSS
jgi:hypothetical protein